MEAQPFHKRILATPPLRQTESPFFKLAAEIRFSIFKLALTDYVDPHPHKRYKENTCFTRPAYFAPRRTDAELLQTCRAIYGETWFMPFVLKEHTHWLTKLERAPPGYRYSGTSTLRREVDLVAKSWGEEAVEINDLRVFAQMFMLEQAKYLAGLISIPYLRFRRLTITIRHTDWWYWETDRPLRFEGSWIKKICEVLPSTAREIYMELESLERKKGQVDAIAQQMREKWFFKRSDGKALFADITHNQRSSAAGDEQADTRTTKDSEDLVTRWSGSSTWLNKRWIADETAPDRLDYYVLTVPFRLQQAVEMRGGGVSAEALRAAQEDDFNKDRLKLHLPNERPLVWEGTPGSRQRWISAGNLDRA